MKISIVTVNYNNAKGLQKTLKSLLSQKYVDFECNIIDGYSTDNSFDVFNDFSDHRFKFYSEPDSGIFDAMNKGIKLSKGDWILFLNSGDSLYSNNVLSRFIKLTKECSDDIKVIYGDCFSDKKKEVIKARVDVDCLKLGLSFASHQSMIIKNQFYYKDDFKIFGDLDLLSFILCNFGEKVFFYKDFTVSIYEGGGVSDSISSKKRIEKYKSILTNYGLYQLIRAFIYRVVL